MLLLSDKAFQSRKVLRNIPWREFLDFMDPTVINVRAGLALVERQIHEEDLNRIRSIRSGEWLSIEKVSKRIWSTRQNTSEGVLLGRSAGSAR